MNLLGQTLHNQFRVDRFLASGGMSQVYQVWDIKRSAYLAMKVLHPKYLDAPSLLEMFQAEAETLQKLSHPNIVPYYGFYHAKDFDFFLELFVDGPTLAEVIKTNTRPMSLATAQNYMKAICSAVTYAHNCGYAHCDIKPSNILITAGSQIYLSDFGIARRLKEDAQTITGAGTPAYMAPEQIRDERISAQTDVYALGVALFEMLSGGHKPYPGDRAAIQGDIRQKILWEQTNLPIPDLRKFQPNLPGEVNQVIRRCLHQNPIMRYSNVTTLMVDLMAISNKTIEDINDESVINKPPEGDVDKINRRSIPIARVKKYILGVFTLIAMLVVFWAFFPDKNPIPNESVSKQEQSLPVQTQSIEKPTMVTSTARQASGYFPQNACMNVLLNEENYVVECVSGIEVYPSGNMKFDFTWTAHTTVGVILDSHLGSTNMYLIDNLGNRYNYLQVGGVGRRTQNLSDGEIVRGWFLFPAPHDSATLLVFLDGDNLVQTPPIPISWR